MQARLGAASKVFGIDGYVARMIYFCEEWETRFGEGCRLETLLLQSSFFVYQNRVCESQSISKPIATPCERSATSTPACLYAHVRGMLGSHLRPAAEHAPQGF
jgi:hypothetical protein